MTSNLNFLLPKNIPWLQWAGCLATTLLTFIIGLTLGWTSPYLARLTAKESPLSITTDEASWVASINNLGRILGAVLGAASVRYFGSKRTLFLNGFPMLFSWSSLILADSVIWLYTARLASGFGLGAAFSSLPMYLGEVASPEIRGALISVAMTGYELGTFVGTAMGAYLSISLFAWISLLPTIITMLLFLWIPESPHYLIHEGKMEEAQSSILRYNPRVDVKVEFESVQNFVSSSSSLKFIDCLREFNIPQNWKCGTIVVALFMFMQASGLNSLVFYLEIILITGKFTAIAPATVVIILNLIAIIAGLSTIFIADRYGRRILWNAGSAGTCVSLIMLGVHFTLLEGGFNPDTLQWLLMVALIFWQVSTFMGPNLIPSIILSELFAPNVKSLAACLASISASVFAFMSSKSYQPMVDALGEAYVFWIHAALMAAAVVFGLSLLPETKGKSLQEIQDSLMKK